MNRSFTLSYGDPEAMCREAVLAHDANAMGMWYLITACAYYHYDETVIADSTFDTLCYRLKQCLGWLTDQQITPLITSDALDAGTCLLDWAETYSFIHAGALALIRYREWYDSGGPPDWFNLAGLT